jgi:hypothetical protein
MASRSASLAETTIRSRGRQDQSQSRRPMGQQLKTDTASDSLRSGLSARASPLIPASLRNDMVREAAYFRAQARGFTHGRELEDWIAAEQEIDELIVRRYGQ